MVNAPGAATVTTAARPPAKEGPADGSRAPRWPHLLALAGLLALALGLRLWGIADGLPYVYNIDEGTHFVPHAVAMVGHTLNPGYFANPPGITYVFRVVLELWFGGAGGIIHAYVAHPAAVYEVARVTVAVLGTVAVWLLYLTGVRLGGRLTGLLAAGLLAVAFLPVFYGHLALNDAATLAPVTLSLLGSMGVLRRGRPLDYLLAGTGLGLACAFKYTAGIVLLPLLGAALVQARIPATARAVGLGVAVAALSALLFFVVANPYAVLDFSHFRAGLAHQSSLTQEVGGKLGAPRNGGLSYYLWTLTWGLGWVPALAALGAAGTLWWRDRRALAVLVPAPVLFLAFMGTQGRYFGRWLLPIFPLLCLLAAAFVVTVAQRVGANRPRLGAAVVAVGAAALLAQGLVYSVHSGLLLSRQDTRGLTRSWMVTNIPIGAGVVVEPIVPEAWMRDIGHEFTQVPNGARWVKWPALRSVIAADGSLDVAHSHLVGIENYELTLSPALIGEYTRRGYCWVVSGTTQSARATTDPSAAPLAAAYYRALGRRAKVLYRASPFSGRSTVGFNFDWSFDYYNLAYRRPGPVVTVYRLDGGRCATAAGHPS